MKDENLTSNYLFRNHNLQYIQNKMVYAIFDNSKRKLGGGL